MRRANFSLLFVCIASLVILSTAYNKTKAKEFWYYQVAALCSIPNLQSWNVSTVSDIMPNVTDIQIINNNSESNLAYSAYDQENNVIFSVFRRTVDTINLLEDIYIIKEDFPECNGCEVHKGFHFAYLNVKDGILQSFQKLKEKYPNAKTAIIGHSLGAAMSTFAFIDIYKKYGHLDYFYTFGSPRVGNEAFVTFVNSLTNVERARITHFHDATPHLPLNYMGYFHISHEIFYNEDSTKFVICEEEIEDPQCSIQFQVFDWSTHDHVNYMGFDHEVYSKNCQ